MKVKYIKVSAADRRPTLGDVFFTIDDGDKGKRLFDIRKRKFFGTTQPEFWLEPVPDREEEMREMLEGILSDLNEDPEDFPTSFWQMKLNNYLTN